jgi:hypothetical protein
MKDRRRSTVDVRVRAWFEPPDILHLLAENPSATDYAEIVAIFITDHDCGPLVIYER